MNPRALALASLVTLAAMAACADHRPSRVPIAAAVVVPIVPEAPSQPRDRLRLFRSYFNVERVGILAHHFTVWYQNIEPSHCRVAVLDANTATVGTCMRGGMSVRPAAIDPMPVSVRTLARAAEDAVLAKMPKARDFAIRYDGAYREIVIGEAIPVGMGTNGPLGWFERIHVRANADLSRIVGKISDGTTGFGVLDIPLSAARIEILPEPALDGQVLFTHGMLGSDAEGTFLHGGGMPHLLLETALGMARDIAAGKPMPTMGPALTGEVNASLSPAYDAPVYAKFGILAWMRKPGPNPKIDIEIPLRLRDAVQPGGQARGSAEADIAGLHIRASATLGRMVPAAPLPYMPTEPPWRPVEMKLTVRIEDNRGHVFERMYPASGSVIVDGPAAATLAFLLPDFGSSNHDREALNVTWPGNVQAGAFDVKLDREVATNPRRRR